VSRSHSLGGALVGVAGSRLVRTRLSQAVLRPRLRYRRSGRHQLGAPRGL